MGRWLDQYEVDRLSRKTHLSLFFKPVSDLNLPLDFAIARRHRAQAFILNGQPAEAIADLALLPHDRAEDVALRLPLLGRAYADCGDNERADGLINRAKSDAELAIALMRDSTAKTGALSAAEQSNKQQIVNINQGAVQ